MQPPNSTNSLDPTPSTSLVPSGYVFDEAELIDPEQFEQTETPLAEEPMEELSDQILAEQAGDVAAVAFEAQLTRFPGLPLNTEIDNEMSQILSSASPLGENQIVSVRMHLRDRTAQTQAGMDLWIEQVGQGVIPEWSPSGGGRLGMPGGGANVLEWGLWVLIQTSSTVPQSEFVAYL